ncbi:MAG: CusA/CzcA family heavy metal efflux RND transporter [Vicinamibacteria bacterium]|nr:CusA/CzcA family heavy metal efflux RND transporter [Vicinamibacteria bacterium]
MSPVERFVAAALRQRPFVLLCLAAFVATGVVAWREVPVEAFPDLTNNQVVVVTEAPGLAAVEVEQRVTYPIETALMGAPGATEVRSLSKFGLSMITVVFEDRVPPYFARQLVAERLAEARGRIPEGLEPALGPVATAFGEIYQYLVEGDAPPMEKKTLHDWDLRARLRSVRGVSEVNSWGGLTKQYHVIVRPRRLERYDLSLHQVVEAVAANNASFSGGFVEHRSERFTVRGSGLASGVEDLRRIVLASVEGVPILLGDVADVEVGPLPRSGAVTRDGRGETVAGMVIMLKGENGKDVATRVKSRIEEIQKTLPAGMRIEPFYDQSEVIDRTSRTVTKNLVEGSLLVVAVLFLFLRDVRASLIVASVIPLSMLAGFFGMRLFGVSANLMSLGAIDFGLIVDGAVVMMENFIRRRAEHDPAGEPGFVADPASHRRRFFTSAATEVARPVLFGVLIIVAVYVPVFTLEGLEGKMFRPMAITVCSAILGALVLALTYVPVASLYLLKIEGSEREEPWFVRLRRYYVAHLEDAMNHPRRTLSVAVAVVTVAVASVAFIGSEFMPRLDEGAILVETRKLPSISLEESAAISTRVEQIIRRFPEVAQVVTKIGRPDVATEAMGIYQGDVYVNLHPLDEWESGWSKEELIDHMAAALAEMPGVACNFTQPMAMRLDEVVSGVKADVAVKVFGPEPELLERVGEEIRGILAGVRGAADLQVEVLSGAAQVQIDVDRGRIARYGLNVADVRELVETAIAGATATELLDGPRRFDVVVRFPDEVRGDPERLGSLLLTAPGGEKVPLASVAAIRTVQGPEAINHEGGQRRLVVQTNVRGRDVGGFVAEAQQKMAAVSLPAGYYVEWGGQFENQQRATRRLMIVIPASLAIIFLLLFLTFGRVRQALLVILNVPFALVGGIAALWIRGLNLNLSASVGFIALFGVAVLNGIVMIAAINRLREEGHLDLRPAILRGAATRLKPVMMTALVAALGFVPMALSHGAGAEVQRPLASVVIGGITTSTLLTLIVLPTLYELLEAWVLKRQQED